MAERWSCTARSVRNTSGHRWYHQCYSLRQYTQACRRGTVSVSVARDKQYPQGLIERRVRPHRQRSLFPQGTGSVGTALDGHRGHRVERGTRTNSGRQIVILQRRSPHQHVKIWTLKTVRVLERRIQDVIFGKKASDIYTKVRDVKCDVNRR